MASSGSHWNALHPARPVSLRHVLMLKARSPARLRCNALRAVESQDGSLLESLVAEVRIAATRARRRGGAVLCWRRLLGRRLRGATLRRMLWTRRLLLGGGARDGRRRRRCYLCGRWRCLYGHRRGGGGGPF